MKDKEVSLLTGAGTSVSSDILNFELMQMKTLEMTDGIEFLTVFTNKFAQRNPDIFYSVYRDLFLVPKREPNSFHRHVTWMKNQHIFRNVITMNLDNLLSKAGCNEVLSMWGNIEDNYCVACKKRFDSEYLRINTIPYCNECQSLILPIFVSRNMVASKSGIDWAKNESKGLILACGTKLEHDFDFSEGLIIVNTDETRYDDQADYLIDADVESVFAELKFLFQNI